MWGWLIICQVGRGQSMNYVYTIFDKNVWFKINRVLHWKDVCYLKRTSYGIIHATRIHLSYRYTYKQYTFIGQSFCPLWLRKPFRRHPVHPSHRTNLNTAVWETLACGCFCHNSHRVCWETTVEVCKLFDIIKATWDYL